MAIAPRPLENKPSRRPVYYPTSDGEPLGETDKHVNLGYYSIYALRDHFSHRTTDVYIAGNNFIYYEEGNPKKVVSPDCYVVFGIEMRLRDCYKVWEEGGKLPSVVFEFTSKTTQSKDMGEKFVLYEQTLKVPEYFLFDPTGDYLTPRLQGYRLVDGRYVEIEMQEGRLHSVQLNLDMEAVGVELRFFDPQTQKWLPTYSELSQQNIELSQQAVELIQRAEAEAQRAEAETQRAKTAEAENARLRAEMEALRRQAGQ
jgi:Uma2 family endonuclease